MSGQTTHQRVPRVLLVDDSRETLAVLRSLLEEEGVDVVGAAVDGLEASHLADGLVPDVVLMDLRMPGLDGFQATRLIKQKHPWMQVIILTFYDELLPTVSPQECGAFAYLVKGCSPSLMRDVIFQAWRHALEDR
jgi:CheY-like chemotaxis protein